MNEDTKTTTRPRRRVPLTELCRQAQNEAAPVISRILPGEDVRRIEAACFQSSI